MKTNINVPEQISSELCYLLCYLTTLSSTHVEITYAPNSRGNPAHI